MVNWFVEGGAEYARARPGYPPELVGYLADVAGGAVNRADGEGGNGAVVDVGCGSGQFTRQLTTEFPAVVGVDPSRSQIAHARPGPGCGFACGAAEALPITDGSASLVTAAQAAHWFDRPAFWEEARRIAQVGAYLALITYATPTFGDPLSGQPPRDAGTDRVEQRFLRFYRQEIGPYWPAERGHIDNGYADFALPFTEIRTPLTVIERHWRLREFLAYVRTWSAVRVIKDAGKGDLVEQFARDAEELWGDADRGRTVRWLVTTRMGRVR